MNMFEEVKKILSKQLRLDESKITMEADLQKDLKADSLEMVELLFNLEEDHGIVIDEEDAAKIKTVGDIVKLMESMQAGK